MIKNLKISTRKIGFRKSWKIMCAVAKCKNKKFSLFSTFAVAFSCSFFVAFLSLKTTKKFFDMTNYFPQKRTLWPGQSLSSPTYRPEILHVTRSGIPEEDMNIVGVKESRDNLACAMMIEMMILS